MTRYGTNKVTQATANCFHDEISRKSCTVLAVFAVLAVSIYENSLPAALAVPLSLWPVGLPQPAVRSHRPAGVSDTLFCPLAAIIASKLSSLSS